MSSFITLGNKFLRYCGEKENVAKSQISVDLNASCGNINMFGSKIVIKEVENNEYWWKICSSEYYLCI